MSLGKNRNKLEFTNTHNYQPYQFSTAFVEFLKRSL